MFYRVRKFEENLQIIDIGGEEKGFSELGSALLGPVKEDAENAKDSKKEKNAVIVHDPKHSLQILNLSNNKIRNRGISNLAKSFQQWPHALRVLDLSQCMITPEGVVALIHAFENNYGMSLTLEGKNDRKCLYNFII